MDIILYGTGKYFENYMMCYGLDQRPLFAVDGDESKWGTSKLGIEIKSPEAIKDLVPYSYYVIICMADALPVIERLKSMGIANYQKYVKVPVENRMIMTLDDGQMLEVNDPDTVPYNVGYVPGVFDMFHTGHLNLLRNAKSRCKFLIAGVLTDELIYHFKNKKPVIPFDQRVAVMSSIKYVDRVVTVDFDNTRKIDAWNMYHYDCHFSGDDHGTDWTRDAAELKAVGAKMEFFRYSSCNSSTNIRNAISQK